MTTPPRLADLIPDDIRAAVAARSSGVATDPEASHGFPVGRPGGRLAGAEIVLTEDMAIPRAERGSLDDWFRWIGGALPEAAFTGMLAATGFEVTVIDRARNARTANPRSLVLSCRAVKPANG